MRTRLLVTGGTGFLGRVVTDRAVRRDWQVTAVGSRDADVRDERAMVALVESARPDVVVHTAYTKDLADSRSVIEDGSANVARAAAGVGARLVHMSSDAVFSGRAGRPYREDDPTDPITEYGAAKAEAERCVAAIAPDSLIVRTSLIYGGPDGPTSLHERAAADPASTFYEDEIRCPIQVHDLADALLELATVESLAGVLHVAGPEALSRRQFAELIVGRSVRSAPAPSDRPRDCRLDSSAAFAVLARTPRAVSDVYASTPS